MSLGVAEPLKHWLLSYMTQSTSWTWHALYAWSTTENRKELGAVLLLQRTCGTADRYCHSSKALPTGEREGWSKCPMFQIFEGMPEELVSM